VAAGSAAGPYAVRRCCMATARGASPSDYQAVFAHR
jgi:hypothetical protein